jgi:hypothetical protein
VLVLATAVVAASGPEPGTPGYVVPWNRAATDSVVDLDPGAKGERFEMSGRLVAPDGVSPMAGLKVYAYHANARGLYADARYPGLDLISGVFRSGPGGGYVIRSTLPGMYEGPPHMHLDADLPGRGRCVWFVSFNPDSASWPLPGIMNLPPRLWAPDEHRAVLHRDPDGVYRTRRTLHVGDWFASTTLDSLRTGLVHKYERAPWRGRPGEAAPSPH